MYTAIKAHIQQSHEHLPLLSSDCIKKLARFLFAKNKAHCKRFLNIVTLPPNFVATLVVIPPSQLGVSIWNLFLTEGLSRTLPVVPFVGSDSESRGKCSYILRLEKILENKIVNYTVMIFVKRQMNTLCPCKAFHENIHHKIRVFSRKALKWQSITLYFVKLNVILRKVNQLDSVKSFRKQR